MSEETKQGDEKPRETQVEFLASLAVTLVMVLFIMTFVGQTFAIPSSSMEDTLLIGDHLFVNRLGFAPRSSWLGPLLPYRAIHRGDIIVFLSPIEANLHLVKRVIGIPGDKVEVFLGHVYINGRELHEPYIKTPWESGNQPAIVLGIGQFWVMGDNRNNSLDSRVFGPVAEDLIVGKAMLSWWPRDTFGLAPNESPTLDKAVTRP